MCPCGTQLRAHPRKSSPTAFVGIVVVKPESHQPPDYHKFAPIQPEPTAGQTLGCTQAPSTASCGASPRQEEQAIPLPASSHRRREVSDVCQRWTMVWCEGPPCGDVRCALCTALHAIKIMNRAQPVNDAYQTCGPRSQTFTQPSRPV